MYKWRRLPVLSPLHYFRAETCIKAGGEARLSTIDGSIRVLRIMDIH